MDLRIILYLALVISCFFVNFSCSKIYTFDNVTSVFHYFKQKYLRTYATARDEMMGLANFLRNLNHVNKMNEHVKNNRTIYMINRYADLSPAEINEHYAIKIKPYVNLTDHHISKSDNIRPVFIEDMELYDLYEINDTYKNWMNKFHKKNYAKPYDRTIHYYKFLQTVVDLNRKKFKGENVSLNYAATTLVNPNQFFVE